MTREFLAWWVSPAAGDGVFEATVWDVAVHPLYQGSGLGRQMMAYVLEALERWAQNGSACSRIPVW